MKKRLILSLFIISLVISSCAGIGQSLLQAPDIKVTNVRVTHLSLTNQNIVFTLGIDNPNPIPIPLKGLTYKLDLNGVEFASGFNESDISIPAGGNSVMDLNINGDLLSFIQKFGGIKQGGLDYNLSGDIALLNRSLRFPYSQGGKLNLGSLF